MVIVLVGNKVDLDKQYFIYHINGVRLQKVKVNN